MSKVRRLSKAVLEARAGDTRKDDYVSSQSGAEYVKMRGGSQRARLLDAFYDHDSEQGLSNEQARELAKLPERSCYWKRCNELREDYGLIAWTPHFVPSTVVEDHEVLVGTSRITPRGQRVVRALREDGWVMVEKMTTEPGER